MISPQEVIYLDSNATTQLDPEVVAEMLPFLSAYYGNPSSGYRFGVQVRDAIDLARERVATLLRCQPSEIIFTSGGTESNNIAINSALQFETKGRHIVTSSVEHSATLRYCEELAKRGCQITFVGVDGAGQLDLAELENSIRPETALITTIWANNETGVISPIERISEIARTQRLLFHADAVQAVGKIPIALGDSEISYCSVSAHKLHGPKGVGALFVNRRSGFRPTFIGGGQENNRRAGTENVAAIVGFGKAAERAFETMQKEEGRVRAMRDQFEARVLESLSGSFVNGDRNNRLPNTSSLSFAGIESEAALILLDQARVCCSAGSACHTGSLQPSHVLRAMRLSEERLRGSLRFSFSRFNSDTDLETVLQILPGVIFKLRAISS